MRDTIDMAREAGFEEGDGPHAGKLYSPHTYDPYSLTSELERFAALVRADEREARGMRWDEYIAKAVESERKAMMQLFTDPENQPTQHGTVTVEYMNREIAAEREACAKVCEEEANRAKWNWDNDISCNQPFWNGGEQLASSCAAVIRARGQRSDEASIRSHT